MQEKIRKDYHMHPSLLKTPEMADRFIKTAISKRIREICITDHMPLSLSKAKDRIPHGRVGAYCRAVRELAKRFEKDISIRCGIEVDYHPSVAGEAARVIEKGDFDYILASSHMHLFVTEFSNLTYNDLASAALENSIKAVETGWFHAVAHLDMFRFTFDNPKRYPMIPEQYDVCRHELLIKQLLDAIAKQGMYLEINPHLAEKKQDLQYVYPAEQIVQWAFEKNIRFSYGSDAHGPKSVGVYLDALEKHPVYGKALEQWESGKT